MKRRTSDDAHPPHGLPTTGRLRIIAGELRSRTIEFSTDPRTRPMKDRTREAVFSLLGGKFDLHVALDLFAGSGILGMEAVSRGASLGVLVELDPRRAKEIRLNGTKLRIDDRLLVFAGDAFAWLTHLDDHAQQWQVRFPNTINRPWCVFVSPPYRMWETHADALASMLRKTIEHAPVGSLWSVELDQSTPLSILPPTLAWETRSYPPAVIAIGEKQA